MEKRREFVYQELIATCYNIKMAIAKTFVVRF